MRVGNVVGGVLIFLGVGARWGCHFQESDWFQCSHIDTVFSSSMTLGIKYVIGPFRVGPKIIKLPESLTSLAQTQFKIFSCFNLTILAVNLSKIKCV